MTQQMRKVLILTNKNDAHARAVTACLMKKEALPVRWFPEEFLWNQRVNHKLTQNNAHTIFITDENKNERNLTDIDVVWFRRAGLPDLPNHAHLADHPFIEAENRMHMKSIWLTLGESAQWVNPYLSFDRSNSKILQLREAARIGLTISDTLISNDKRAIANFITENQPIKTLYKTFSPAMWQEDNKIISNYATAISISMLSSDLNMAMTPGIYQKVVLKEFELRVTFFGDEYVAVKIHNAEALDWRVLSARDEIKISPIKIPNDIENKCKLLMKQLGIVFGCFDFIVTPQAEYVFLEVNEMGQFLWIENMLPEMRLLDKFCEFLLTTPKQNTAPKQKKSTISLQEIVGSTYYQKLAQEDLEKQKNLEFQVTSGRTNSIGQTAEAPS